MLSLISLLNSLYIIWFVSCVILYLCIETLIMSTKDSARKAIEDIIIDLEAQLKHWKYSLTLLGGESINASSTPKLIKAKVDGLTYSKNMSKKQKAAFILKMANRFLHISEINQLYQQLENVDPGDKKALDAIRNGLANLKIEGSASNFKAANSNQSYVWGSTKWFDDNGKPKPEFMYKEGLFDKNNDNIEI